MSLRRVIAPKRPRNLKATLIVGAVMVVVWAGWAWRFGWSPKRGLGLAFATRVAAAHGGVLSLQPRRGGGTSVSLWLPRNEGPAAAPGGMLPWPAR